MNDRIQAWLAAHPYAQWFYPTCLLVTSIVFAAASTKGNGYVWLYLGAFVLLLFAFRPNSALHALSIENATRYQTLFSVFVAMITIAACTLPMAKLPLWNGEIPGHRNQYELITEAILDGRIEFAYGDEEALSQLQNPYDPDERQEAGVKYHWDHAYYNGHYYMYFGIVPVFLVFLPYRILTGTSLTTYHATQIFAAFSIAGIFVLFHLLARLFFKKLPYSVYLLLSVAFSAMSVWYSTAEPALYCTAITGAIALEIWSLYFFIRAVWGEERENRQILFAGIGAVLGALVFGCRPPIALANLLVIPMLIRFLTQRKFTPKLLGKLLLVALPYVLMAGALMTYNYIRFDDPFEFGQAYQLTVQDQTSYRITFDPETLLRIYNDTLKNFFAVGEIRNAFPFLRTSSVFFNFPALSLCILLLCKSSVLKNIRQARLLPFVIGLFLAVFIITAADIMWSPRLLERYRMDIYFLMGIACFIIIGMWYNACTEKGCTYLNFVMAVLSVITVISAFLLCVQTIGTYYPNVINAVAKALRLT